MRLKHLIISGIVFASAPAVAECTLGEITTFTGNFVPRGYMAADGALIPIMENQSLFSILGTTYGGDGRNDFALPNIQNGLTHQAASGSSSGERRLRLRH